MANSFDLLPLEERIQQYREMADATFLEAQRTGDCLVRTKYLDLATQWHALAQQLESGNLDPEAAQPVPDADARRQSDKNEGGK